MKDAQEAVREVNSKIMNTLQTLPLEDQFHALRVFAELVDALKYDRGREHSECTLDGIYTALIDMREELIAQGLLRAWKEELPLTDEEIRDIDVWLEEDD